jgi:hypothetical protein
MALDFDGLADEKLQEVMGGLGIIRMMKVGCYDNL